MRVVGLWLFYATVGVVLVAMAIGTGGDLGSGASSSPTRLSTKLLGALSGVAFAVAGLGAYWRFADGARVSLGTALLGAGAGLGALLSVVAMVLIARDLRGGPYR